MEIVFVQPQLYNSYCPDTSTEDKQQGRNIPVHATLNYKHSIALKNYIQNMPLFNKYIWAGLVLLVINSSCNQKKSSSQLLSIKVSDSAMMMLTKSDDTGTYLRILDLLDSAIKLDKYNITAYNNKASILVTMKRVDEANQVFERAISLSNNYNMILFQGMIYEKLYKDSLTAYQKYEQAFTIVDSICNASPRNKAADMDKCSILLFLKGKDAGIAAYNMLLNKYKGDKAVIAMKPIFYDFNRQDYLAIFGN